MRQRRTRPGMTLLEVLCVMAILIILLSVALPSIEGMYGDIRLTAASDHVRSVFAEARAHAIESGQAYRFAIKPGDSSYRVAPDGGDFWEGGSESSSSSEGDVLSYVVEGRLEKVIFKLASGGGGDSGGWTTVATFLPDGTCGDDSEIQLYSDGCRPISFRVRALTGAVRVRTISNREGQ